MRDVFERFWEKVNMGHVDVCWEWQASCDRGGYGQFGYEGKMAKAHRMAMFLSGKLAELKGNKTNLVLHRCNNKRCVNPNHLYVGTDLDNMRDALKAGVLNTKRRSRHSPEIRQAALDLDLAGKGVSAIARELGVSISFVASLIKRQKKRNSLLDN